MNKYWSSLTSNAWVSGTVYTKGDVTTYNNSTYVCINNTTNEQLELSPADDTEHNYWKQINNWE